MSGVEEQKKEGVRIAVEGCGHGTLHAIYASVEEACRVKGWDGVDLLIIGGDFQAVRNRYDLNVTAMPAKYRRMADFHEYYSGARTAPYLTIFIGGNHEASNHLFELYYGGWVAPNIYYLGAANVIRLGPIRIAGLTGIWKGYDYRKPHFERLPYNQEDIHSIFHVRELDVRKLLSLRSQVDIGLSHDWPQGVEYHGDYQWLFRKRKDFEADSSIGKLGSVAARQCLDRLRPPYWFSAHLHTKFAAVFQHDKGDTSPQAISKSHPTSGRVLEESDSAKMPSTAPSVFTEHGNVTPRPEDRQQVSALQQLHAPARQGDAEERDRVLRERETERLQEEKTDASSPPQFSVDEMFKKIGRGDGLERIVVSTTRSQPHSEDHDSIQNLDGCFCSRPAKRQRLETGHPGSIHDENDNDVRPDASGNQMDGASASFLGQSKPAVANPDSIDIDMSDDSDTTEVASQDVATPRSKPLSIPAVTAKVTDNDHLKKSNSSQSPSEESEDGGVKLNAQAASFTPLPGISSLQDEASHSQDSPTPSGISSESELNQRARLFKPESSPNGGVEASSAQSIIQVEPEKGSQLVDGTDVVPEEIRAQLAALSSKFRPKEPSEVSPSLPFPEEIANKTTYFLALGKCDAYQEFLQLLEIQSMTSPEAEIRRPLKLYYDPEWLAIQRVFAPELQLGGIAKDRVPAHRGETYYRDQIVKEQEWIIEHVVKPGKLQIPENFSMTAPVYDPSLQVAPDEMPREVTNPQSSRYCELIGIENKFDASEEERDSRMQQGPRPERAEFHAHRDRPRQQGLGGGRGRGNHRGGGGGGGRGGARGSDRARGRGRRY
ncbi:uncharacterized protein Z519_01902 [Cladophialophora bantiana CBS 173.52]|uniref:Lariat debranching enzyme C-terminal domain-containing protein n=1 Tax=Cladophialophora bantiana (strain ATCC 10958 / CBS 173.52 / CDC B-1940 / NIH 8579) TaxID=1442370 RepID=A0A0D2HY06_CLAB1|nr:uncharacterized protein Z519_01902 [Cladophialophora bantiana CBS 173.52]KIW98318.1 hypothetical protein Z519_01902 [Cladophialophora bantiana CBS 173.52]